MSLVLALVAELRQREATCGERASVSSVTSADSPKPNGAAAAAADGAARREPANSETTHLHHVRWAKLAKDFYKPKKGTFDTTKIPDIYDNAVYD
eukprot:3988324-Prymnesium_polylepis.1